MKMSGFLPDKALFEISERRYKMPFQNIPAGDDIREVIKSAFDIELDISGAWGYEREQALIINSTQIPLQQLQHSLASMRAFIEMNLTMPEEKRYGAINVNETKRECISEDGKIYDKVVYEISGMPERDYERLIEEYKQGYESPDFDIDAHFRKRKEVTVIFEKPFWFDITDINKRKD